MNNERIDLAQFEGMTEGTWHFCLPYNAKTDTYEGDAQMKGGGNRVNGPVILSQYQFARGTVDQRADLRAMESCPELIAELKRCYKELDELPTRQELMDIFDYQKWLEYVESCFLADGSFNQDADFVRMCAVNEKYGYRIEVIDGVETVVHESEY